VRTSVCQSDAHRLECQSWLRKVPKPGAVGIPYGSGKGEGEDVPLSDAGVVAISWGELSALRVLSMSLISNLYPSILPLL